MLELNIIASVSHTSLKSGVLLTTGSSTCSLRAWRPRPSKEVWPVWYHYSNNLLPLRPYLSLVSALFRQVWKNANIFLLLARTAKCVVHAAGKESRMITGGDDIDIKWHQRVLLRRSSTQYYRRMVTQTTMNITSRGVPIMYTGVKPNILFPRPLYEAECV